MAGAVYPFNTWITRRDHLELPNQEELIAEKMEEALLPPTGRGERGWDVMWAAAGVALDT